MHPGFITATRFLFRSLRFYWRMHLGVLLGATLACAILTGALLVGDSVRYTLERIALNRLGRTELALVSNDRFFETRLADDLAGELGGSVAPVLMVRGVASTRDRSKRANEVQVVGVDERFWSLSIAWRQSDPPPHPEPTHPVPTVDATSPLTPTLSLGGEREPDSENSASPRRGRGRSRSDRERVRGRPLPGVESRGSSVASFLPEVVVNDRLAARLGLKAGNTLIVRLEKPGYLSRDVPLSGKSDSFLELHGKIGAVVGSDDFGSFSLQANQIAPLTVFVPLAFLQEFLQRPGRANVLLAGGFGEVIRDQLSVISAALRKHWTLADANLELRALPEQGAIELRSDEVFIDRHVAAAALGQAPTAMGVLSYFVNQIRVGDRTNWYSVVSGVEEGMIRIPELSAHRQAAKPQSDEFVIPSLRGISNFMQEIGDSSQARNDNHFFWSSQKNSGINGESGIIFNSWLAEHLAAKIGDQVTLRYYVMGDQRRLTEQEATFRLRAIVPIAGWSADAELLPKFPGLYGTKHCGEWEPGVPINLDNLTEKDQRYWETYQGTPKAFIPLAAAQHIWGNRFGELTAVRWPMKPNDVRDGTAASGASPVTRENLDGALRAAIEPAQLGLYFQPVRQQALAASRQSLDFGQLFIGFSFFLIIAALLLMGMLFAFNVEQRAEEIGVFLSLGFTPRRVRRFLMLEGVVLAVIGTAIGTAMGVVYTRLTLHGLATVWRDAVGTSQFYFQARPTTLLMGALSSVAAVLVSIWLAARGQTQRSAAQIIAGGSKRAPRPLINRLIIATGLCGAAVLLASSGGVNSPDSAPAFFVSGVLLLAAGIGMAHGLLVGLSRTATPAASLQAVGTRGAGRRRGRSLASIGVLGSGVFLLVAVNAFRHDPVQGAGRRESGTGGFALFAQSTLPLYDDFNDPAGLQQRGVAAEIISDVSVVGLRVRDGDDASCLNLNRAQQPRLLGVRPAALFEREAFTFTRAIEKANPGRAWRLLDRHERDDAVPAIGDEQTVTWALGKKLGETLPYTDDDGNAFQLRIVGITANSILQGGLVISEKNFIQRFPSEAGYRMFLIDAPANRSDQVSQALTRSLAERGIAIVPAWQRLAEFYAVENTYLEIFQALGGLGLLLGSLGLGIVVLRNVLERRGELALLQAIGFRKRALQWLVVSEHWLLVALGILVGVAAAVLAVLPALQSPGAHVPYKLLAATLVGIAAGSLGWSWLAARVALRGPLMSALRNE